MTAADRELIEAQNQLIGILFEIIKRLQANSNLDDEYFSLVSKGVRTEQDKTRLDEILKEKTDNTNVTNRLLQQLDN